MVTEARETGRDEAGGPGEIPASPSRRFAGLVEAHAARRVSPRRLAGAVAASLLGLAAFGLGGLGLIRWVAGWVGSLPEYQVPFSRIELVPPPPPYIRGGAEGFLDRVRAEAGRGETIPHLSIDLAGLGDDFRRCPWVKGVTRVERSSGRLAVHLAYREPVAVVRGDPSLGFPIDDEGVILPREDRDTDWVAKGPTFLVRGLDAPLIEIREVSRPAGTLPGLCWKRLDGECDAQVRGAARLARFLRGQGAKTPGGKAVPRLARIVPSDETPEFYLYDAANRCIFWGAAPDSEERGMPRAAAKWSMLLAWIDEHGALPAGPGEYLTFDHSAARVGRARGASGPSSGKIREDRPTGRPVPSTTNLRAPSGPTRDPGRSETWRANSARTG